MLECILTKNPDLWSTASYLMSKIGTSPEVAHAIKLILIGARPQVLEFSPNIDHPCNQAFQHQYLLGQSNTAGGIIMSNLQTANNLPINNIPTSHTVPDQHWSKKCQTILQDLSMSIWKTRNKTLHDTLQ